MFKALLSTVTSNFPWCFQPRIHKACSLRNSSTPTWMTSASPAFQMKKNTYKNSVIHHTFCFESTNVEKSETAIGIFILSDFLISLISFEVYELYSADFPTARQHPRVATLLNQHFKHHQRAAPSSNPKISKQRGCNNWSTQCQISTITTGHKVIQV